MGQSDHRPQVFQVFKVSSNVYNVRRQESTWGKAISKVGQGDFERFGYVHIY